MSETRTLITKCCVAGGGPAGLMFGFLLARAGVDVIVLEKHADFLRDFRGDTIHPSTLELLYELGLIDDFLETVKPQRYPSLNVVLNGRVVEGPDFTGLPTHCRFMAVAPQWDFLNFLAERGARYPTFRLMMSAEATELIQGEDRVRGVRVRQGEETLEVQADLVVSADGRGSKLREQVGLKPDEIGVPIDVLWFRLPKIQEDPQGPILGRIGSGTMMVTIDRGDYFQCGQVITKGRFDDVRSQGLPAFCEKIIKLAPFLEAATQTLTDWDQVKLLNVQINRLAQWAVPGYLCIGDAAHAMSPAGGVGVNFAIQDAVAASNLLAEKLRIGSVTLNDLNRVQQRRESPVKQIQHLQAFAHRHLFNPDKGFQSRGFGMTVVRGVASIFAPIVRRIMARLIGLGPLPEKIETEEFITETNRS